MRWANTGFAVFFLVLRVLPAHAQEPKIVSSFPLPGHGQAAGCMYRVGEVTNTGDDHVAAVFALREENGGTHTEVWLSTLHTWKPQRLIVFPPGDECEDFRLLPDGRSAVYRVRGRDRVERLYRVTYGEKPKDITPKGVDLAMGPLFWLGGDAGIVLSLGEIEKGRSGHEQTFWSVDPETGKAAKLWEHAGLEMVYCIPGSSDEPGIGKFVTIDSSGQGITQVHTTLATLDLETLQVKVIPESDRRPETIILGPRSKDGIYAVAVHREDAAADARWAIETLRADDLAKHTAVMTHEHLLKPLAWSHDGEQLFVEALVQSEDDPRRLQPIVYRVPVVSKP